MASDTLFVDSIAAEVGFDEDQKKTLASAYLWLSKYFQILNPEQHMPVPQGTRYEAWTTLHMVTILSGYKCFPTPQTCEAVALPDDFGSKVEQLTRLLGDFQ
jgi:hypothetical protein